MLVYTLLKTLVDGMNTVFAYFPSGATLPTWFGVDLDYYVGLGFAYYHLLERIFPPLTVLMLAAVIYLTWRLIIINGLRAALGHRAPIHR